MTDCLNSKFYGREDLLVVLRFFLGSSHLQYRGLRDFKHKIVGRNAQVNAIVLGRHDRAPQAPAGGDPVPSLERVEHGLPLFLAALLGKNWKKIKDAEDENKRRNATP